LAGFLQQPSHQNSFHARSLFALIALVSAQQVPIDRDCHSKKKRLVVAVNPVVTKPSLELAFISTVGNYRCQRRNRLLAAAVLYQNARSDVGDSGVGV